MRKTKSVKKLLTALAGLAIIIMGIVGWKMELRVQAAEPPVVSDLKVAAGDDGAGVMAQCSYQNYDDQSGCELTLYLYRAEKDGTHTIVAYKTLSYAASATGSIDAVSVPEGTYFTSVVMNYSGMITQINSQYYYKVRLVDGDYVVTQENAGTADDASSIQEYERIEESGKPDCIHVWEYSMAEPATKEKDSLLSYQCAICGEVIEYVEVPNSAYSVFLTEAADAIWSSQTDQVIIDAERWISFDQRVLDAISGRRDVTIVVNYKYQGKKCSVIIPNGADVSGLADETGFCGFRYLDQVFGGGEIEE